MTDEQYPKPNQDERRAHARRELIERAESDPSTWPPGPKRAILPRRAVTAAVAGDVIRRQFAYSMAGLGVGLVCILLGLTLFVRGVTGATGWVVQLVGVKSSLSDAAPGVVLAVIGLVVIYVTRFDVRAEK